MCPRRAAMRSARISSTRASASSNPRSRNTLRLAGVVCRTPSLRIALISYLPETALRQIDIRPGRLLSLLLEAVKDVYRLRARRQIDDTKGSRHIPHTYFPHPRSHTPYGLPIRWLKAALHKIQVKSRIPSRFIGKSLQIIVTGAHEMQRLACPWHVATIQILVLLYKYL